MNYSLLFIEKGDKLLEMHLINQFSFILYSKTAPLIHDISHVIEVTVFATLNWAKSDVKARHQFHSMWRLDGILFLELSLQEKNQVSYTLKIVCDPSIAACLASKMSAISSRKQFK